ncbi:hypothetical protein [Aestuariispira insulae]|uniref:Uncharacterized protein n=1 Tax=Aestuariispira insulae TaxID=1461337 RepID=A0A3D9HNK2_9PROT|nr:hypothetical protein [Aestuariispira insulae]RED50985.1 hypothetical protein DFP90_104259 [Aestuariispira insulae]
MFRSILAKPACLFLLAANLLSGCEYAESSDPGYEIPASVDPSDIPLAAGNTFDYWNRLDKISPNAAIVNINYKYLFDHTTGISAPGMFDAKSWAYIERDPAEDRKILFISVREEAETVEDPSGRVLVFGRHQLVSDAHCLDADNPTEDETIAPYEQAAKNRFPDLDSPILLHRFLSREKEEDNTRLEMVHILDLAPYGLTCTDLGNLEEPSEEMAKMLDELYSTAQRSFEMIG